MVHVYDITLNNKQGGYKLTPKGKPINISQSSREYQRLIEKGFRLVNNELTNVHLYERKKYGVPESVFEAADKLQKEQFVIDYINEEREKEKNKRYRGFNQMLKNNALVVIDNTDNGVQILVDVDRNQKYKDANSAYKLNLPQIRKQQLTDIQATYFQPNDSLDMAWQLNESTDWKLVKEQFTPKNLQKLFYGVIEHNYDPEYVQFLIYKRNTIPQDFIVADDPTINCVLKAIRDKFPELANEINKLEIRLINDKYVNQHIAVQIAKKLKVRLIFYHQLGVWFDTQDFYKKKMKHVSLLIHNTHVVEYQPPNFKASRVVYTKDLTPHLQYPAIKKLSIKVTGDNPDNLMPDPVAVTYDGVTYKTYRPPNNDGAEYIPYSEQEEAAYKLRNNEKLTQTQKENIRTYKQKLAHNNNIKNYYSCNDELSYTYKKFKVTNNLFPPQQPYYDLIKSSIHFLNNLQLNPYNQTKEYHNYDICKAYSGFKSSPYYNHYKLPVGYYQLLDTSSADLNTIIQLTGWSYITNVKINNAFIDEIKWIQPNNMYTHIRLKKIIDMNYATFSIQYSIISQPEDLKFPFKDINLFKEFNNSLIGYLIAGGLENDKVIYTPVQVSNEIEYKQVEYYCHQNNIRSSPTPWENILNIERTKPNTSLVNIASYIYDYYQLAFVEAMERASKVTTILTYIVDGFYTTDPLPTDFLDFGTNPHQFKYKQQMVKGMYDTQKPVHQPLDLNKITSLNPPRYQVYQHRLSPINLTTGPAGAGKSSTFSISPPVDSVLTTPTHLLKYCHIINAYTFKSTLTNIKTAHRLFNLNNNPKIPDQYPNTVIVDEITMFTQKQINHMIEKSKKYRFTLHFIGDYDPVYGPQQLRPVNDKTIDNDLISKFNINVYEQTDAKRRQQDLYDQQLLDSLRGKSYEQQLAILLLSPKVKRISYNSLINDYQKEDIAITYTNGKANEFNNILLKQKNFIKVKTLKNKTHTPKGSILSIDNIPKNKQLTYTNITKSAEIKEIPNEFEYMLAYMATADAIQGSTHNNKVFIDLFKANERPGLLYTAATRVTDLNNLFIIDN